MIHRKYIIVLATLLMPALAHAEKVSPIVHAEKLHRHGSYAAAQAAYGKLLRGKKRERALLGLARMKLEVGEPAAALLAARKVRGKKLGPAARVVAGQALRARGKLAEAEAELLGVAPGAVVAWLRAQVELGKLHLERGETARAQAAFERLYDAFDAGKVSSTSAEQLTLVAMACRYSDNFRDAADTLAQALQVEPTYLEAYLELGEISLEKYEAGHAERHLGNALKSNPNHPRALVGLARVKLDQSTQITEALKLLERAGQVAPGDPEPRVVLAGSLLDAERYAEAEEALVRALDRNPRHLGAMSMLGASFLLRDDLGSFKRMRARVLKLNPRYSAFFRVVVHNLVRHHRYAEALELGKEAIKLDPRDWFALAELGTNYLRLGDDEQGLKLLRQAWKGDRFNVRTYNLLNLFDEELARHYIFIGSAHFKLRVHKDEAKIIARTVVPELERAYAVYARKYRFKPHGPIIIELFKDPKSYAIRTVGLPGLGALGVCFGRVITAISPVGGRFNWGQVLWHELNHVFTIQLSRSRVPRWLTEGLADMEPTLRRAEWKRENDFDIYRALARGKLRPLSQMNTAFTQARSMNDMVVAYYHGSLMARYLVERFGLPRVLEGLKAFARGKRLPQALALITGGVAPAELDRRFLKVQKKRLAPYASSFYVDPERYRDLEASRQRVKARPADMNARAALALSLLVAGKNQEAQEAVDEVRAKLPDLKLTLFAAAQLSLARNDRTGAATLLKRLLAVGGDGYEARLMLGRLYLEQGNLVLGKKHLDRAKKFDPERARPWMLMARVLDRAGKSEAEIRELKALVKLDQQNGSAVERLVELLAKKKDWSGVREFGQMAYFIKPASARLHLLLARALSAPAPRRDLKQARWHAETAALINPGQEGLAALKKKLKLP